MLEVYRKHLLAAERALSALCSRRKSANFTQPFIASKQRADIVSAAIRIVNSASPLQVMLELPQHVLHEKHNGEVTIHPYC